MLANLAAFTILPCEQVGTSYNSTGVAAMACSIQSSHATDMMHVTWLCYPHLGFSWLTLNIIIVPSWCPSKRCVSLCRMRFEDMALIPPVTSGKAMAEVDQGTPAHTSRGISGQASQQRHSRHGNAGEGRLCHLVISLCAASCRACASAASPISTAWRDQMCMLQVLIGAPHMVLNHR